MPTGSPPVTVATSQVLASPMPLPFSIWALPAPGTEVILSEECQLSPSVQKATRGHHLKVDSQSGHSCTLCKYVPGQYCKSLVPGRYPSDSRIVDAEGPMAFAISDLALPVYWTPPLHASILLGRHPDVLRALLRQRPEACAEPCNDQPGMLPLQLAIHMKTAEAAVLQILAVNPSAAAVPMCIDNRLPLHIAVGPFYSAVLIRKLIAAYPQSLSHHHCRVGLPLHAALQAHAPDAVISTLLEAYPQAAREPYPFRLAVPSQQHWRHHVNCMSLNEVAVGSSVMIRTTSPHDGLQVGEVGTVSQLHLLNAGKSNSVLISATVAGADGREMKYPIKMLDAALPLERAMPLVAALVLRRRRYHALRCSCREGSLVASILQLQGVIPDLIRASPAAAAIVCSDMLPLHVACCVGCSADWFEALIQAHPEGRIGLNGSGQSPLHIALLTNAPAQIVNILAAHGSDNEL